MTTQMNLPIKYFVFFFILLGMTACKTTSETTAVSGTLDGMSASDYFKQLIESNLDYNTLSFKMNVELNAGKKAINSKATLKMEKDKNIQISVQPFLGIEAFRLQITPDSIIVIDRLNRRYIAENMAQLKAQNTNFDFSVLQALFTNEIFVPNKGGLVTLSDKTAFDIQRKNDKMLLTGKTNKSIDFVFTGNLNNKLSSTSIASKSGNFAMDWKYSSFDSSMGNLFPKKMDVDMERKDKKVNMILSISKIEKNDKVDFNISIPSKYKRIEIDGLFNLFTP